MEVGNPWIFAVGAFNSGQWAHSKIFQDTLLSFDVQLEEATETTSATAGKLISHFS